MDAPLWTGAGVSEVIGLDRATTALTYAVSGDFSDYGGWTEIGVTTDKWEMFEVIMRGETSETPYRIRVGLGAAGSEVVIVDGLRLQNRGESPGTYLLPLGVPAGTRVAVATSNQGQGSASGVFVALRGFGGHPYGLAPYSRAIDINPANNSGVLIAGSGTAHTLTAWTELVASTSEDMRLMIPFVASETGNSGQYSFVDFAVGAAGSEVAVLEGVYVAKLGANPYLSPLNLYPLPISIPAGSRISARVQSDNATVDDVRVSLLGIS